MYRDPFGVRCLVYLAYRKGLISVVTLSVVVPQAIGSFLHNSMDNVMEFVGMHNEKSKIVESTLHSNPSLYEQEDN